MSLADIQAEKDHRGRMINQVGICDVTYPITLSLKDFVISSIAKWALTVQLPATEKGTHMSRFIRWLNEYAHQLSLETLIETAQIVLKQTNAHAGQISAHFTTLIEKHTPVTQQPCMMDYKTILTVQFHSLEKANIFIKIVVPVKSLCPASKAMATYGAHSQRSHITATLKVTPHFDLLSAIKAFEQCGSAELFGLLRREDEKYITEHAYDHPKFVEDIVRDAAATAENLAEVSAFIVECENFESIHNHSAYAKIAVGLDEHFSI